MSRARVEGQVAGGEAEWRIGLAQVKKRKAVLADSFYRRDTAVMIFRRLSDPRRLEMFLMMEVGWWHMTDVAERLGLTLTNACYMMRYFLSLGLVDGIGPDFHKVYTMSDRGRDLLGMIEPMFSIRVEDDEE